MNLTGVHLTLEMERNKRDSRSFSINQARLTFAFIRIVNKQIKLKNIEFFGWFEANQWLTGRERYWQWPQKRAESIEMELITDYLNPAVITKR